MLQRFLFITLTLCSLTASAQWQQTGSKVRYVNGLGIPTKDTAAGVSADSSQIVIRPADSSLYVKYKRTWLRVGGGAGGGSIGGSGTTNYVPKFTASGFIGNSILIDNNNSVSIGNTASSWRSGANAIQFGTNRFGSLWQQSSGAVDLAFAAYESATNVFSYTSTGDAPTLYQQVSGVHLWANAPSGTAGNTITFNERMRITAAGDVGIGTASPVYPLQISKTLSANQTYLSLNNATNTKYNWGIDWDVTGIPIPVAAIRAIYPADNDISLGFYTYNGSGNVAERMRITAAGDVGIGTASPAAKLSVQGTTLINTNTDNGVDKLQVSGSMNVSTLATTNNLSVTNNATVGGTATITGNTQINGLIGVNTTPASYAIKLQSSGNNIIEFGTQSATNYSRFLHSSSQPFGTIGNASGAGISGGSNGDFAIGTPSGSNNIIFHINAVERVRIKTDGEVLVFSSTDNGAYNLQCNGTGVWGAGAYVNGSDSALKYQIKDIDNALHLVMQLKPKTYKYKPFYNNSTETQTGFIAQDLEKVLKNEIYKDGVVISGGKYKGVAYNALIPLLVKTIQEQQSQIEDIKKQIEELKKLIKQ